MLFILYARTPFWMNIVAGPIISYFSIAMNIIIFVALFHKNIRSPTTIVMQGLALADGLTALCTYGFEPFFNLHYEEIIKSTSKLTSAGHFDTIGNSHHEGPVTQHISTAKIEEMKLLLTLKFPYCVLHYCLSNLVEIFHLESILLTTCLGLQKFLAVACPIWSKTQITENRSVIVCMTCFLLPLTLTIPRLFVVSLSRGQKGDKCLVSEPNQTLQNYVLAYHPIFYAIILVGAVVIMLLSTCFIIFTLCRRKRVRGHIAASRAEKKSCILIVLVMTVFFLSEVPRIFISVTLFSTYRSHLDSTNVASHLTNIIQFQTYSECLPDDIFGLDIYRLGEFRNRSCISNSKEIPSKYKVERKANRYLKSFAINIESTFRLTCNWYVTNLFKDEFGDQLCRFQKIDLGSLVARKAANRIHEVAHGLAVELYCSNKHLRKLRRKILDGLSTYFFHFDEAWYCKINKLLDSSFFLGSSPYSEQMNYILIIASGHIDITMEHLKLITEILKFSMIIGCGSNFLIYIIMSEKLRNALKKTFKCGSDQDVREDVMEMQSRR
ncbi:Hypothetical predicted protein [Mytilus galloprovincialis]|uniref:G-protein coupled receptors family 1 profile domain-containing protein n=1 Tax=Mytilus galloprovincialis TaxID=29158 RepID=A0A8B6FNC8_MYTGA|nr:Hypothetical predicted protein [Mytilus galloprovincialis]